jgi:hypothetical protein
MHRVRNDFDRQAQIQNTNIAYSSRDLAATGSFTLAK